MRSIMLKAGLKDSRQDKHNNMKREKNVFTGQLLMAVSVFFFGLSYDFAVFLFAVVLFSFLLVFYWKIGRIKFILGKQILIMTLFLAAYLGAVFIGIEHGICVIGFFRMLVVMLWVCILMQYSKEEKDSIMLSVPYSGMAMVLICIICYPLENIKDWLFNAQRMGGMFQYSNTFALYLLIGVIVLSYEKSADRKYYLKLMILLFGILCSGSRSVFVFTVLALIFLALRNKNRRTGLLALIILAMLFGILFVYLTGREASIGRFTTISISSSTFLGRVLYNMDALPLLLKHPFGLGYMGYFFIQPQIQHGIYSVRYVHNDWLQIGLDSGILAVILFAILVISNIVLQYRKNERNVMILILVALHMFIDFDLTFISMMIVVVTCMDWNGKEKVFAFKKAGMVPCVCGMVVYAWLFLSTGLDYIGKAETSLAIYPWNSQVETKVMLQSMTSKEAEPYAEHILTENSLSYAAYNVKAVAAMDRGEYMKMLKYKQKALEITRYALDEYKDYVVMLKIAIEAYEEQGDLENRQQCIDYLLQVETMLENVRKDTNFLAYKLDEKPNLELPKEYKEYIHSFE